MTDKGKTIKQIADEIGVSKQALQKRISREPLFTKIQSCISSEQGTKYINETGEVLINDVYGKHKSIDTSIDIDNASIDVSIEGEQLHVDGILVNDELSIDRDNLSMDASIDNANRVDTLISMLQRELEIKNKQIEDLTTALEHTTASLHAAQALHAGTMQKQLTDSVFDAEEQDTAPSDARPEKINWFRRLFGKHI